MGSSGREGGGVGREGGWAGGRAVGGVGRVGAGFPVKNAPVLVGLKV